MKILQLFRPRRVLYPTTSGKQFVYAIASNIDTFLEAAGLDQEPSPDVSSTQAPLMCDLQHAHKLARDLVSVHDITFGLAVELDLESYLSRTRLDRGDHSTARELVQTLARVVDATPHVVNTTPHLAATATNASQLVDILSVLSEGIVNQPWHETLTARLLRAAVKVLPASERKAFVQEHCASLANVGTLERVAYLADLLTSMPRLAWTMHFEERRKPIH